MRIDLLEDDPDQAEMISHWLTEEGHDVRWYRSGGDMTRALHRDVPDVLLLDWVLPESSGMDVLTWVRQSFLGRIPQPSVTYTRVGNINEHQVSIGETTYGGREELAKPAGIVDYGSLMYIALERAKTAREAITVMTSLTDEFGYASTGESFSIADPNEAWILEMIGKGEGQKGAVWVAVKVPDGYVSAHANQARISTFPQNDPANAVFAKDVIAFAREKGWFSGQDAEFSFADTYAPLEFGGARFCEARVWSFFRRVAPSMKWTVAIGRASWRESV